MSPGIFVGSAMTPMGAGLNVASVANTAKTTSSWMTCLIKWCGQKGSVAGAGESSAADSVSFMSVSGSSPITDAS